MYVLHCVSVLDCSSFQCCRYTHYCVCPQQLVRLVANLSVHPEAGPAIAQDKDTVDHLFCILGVLAGWEIVFLCWEKRFSKCCFSDTTTDEFGKVLHSYFLIIQHNYSLLKGL